MLGYAHRGIDMRASYLISSKCPRDRMETAIEVRTYLRIYVFTRLSA